MYKHIYVPADNSEHSNRAVDLGLALAKAFGAKLTASHVYAAKMHDVRFKQMEYTLPQEYQEETELLRQRKIHDSLITMGLQLISDCYLEPIAKRAAESGVPFEAKTFDGKNWEALVKDIESSDYDLVVLGALGTGAVKHSSLGSVCERVVRRCRRDVLVVKDVRPLAEQTGPVVVGVDGSPQAFAGVQAALELNAVRVGAAWSAAGDELPVQGIAVYDPYLHYTVFNGIVGVLNERASKIFRFKEQEQLHEDIIDTGLAKIYQSHLDVAGHVAREKGATLRPHLKDGKAYEKVHAFVEGQGASLLVVGRVGVHNGDLDIGSNAENLLRLSRCNVLLVSRKHVPPIDVKAEASMLWTEEARTRFERVPESVRGIARTAVHRYAMERGHSIITNSIIDEVMAIFMPKTAGRLQEAAAEVAKAKLAELEAEGGKAYVCTLCGKIARGFKPKVCAVCSAPEDSFGLLERRSLEALSSAEGELSEEAAFDGVRLKWTEGAKKRLYAVKDAYIRRRAKAQAEKSARVRGLAAIDLALLDEVLGRDVKSGEEQVTPHVSVNNELASPLPLPEKWTKAPTPGTAGAAASSFVWTEEAAARLNRVPSGFMRENTRAKIEEFAAEKGATTVTLELAEGGIERAKQLMASMMAAYTPPKASPAP